MLDIPCTPVSMCVKQALKQLKNLPFILLKTIIGGNDAESCHKGCKSALKILLSSFLWNTKLSPLPPPFEKKVKAEIFAKHAKV